MSAKKLSGSPRPAEVYFNPYTVPTNGIVNKKQTDKKQVKRPPLAKTNIETSLNSIYATVHNNLKTSHIQPPKLLLAPIVPMVESPAIPMTPKIEIFSVQGTSIPVAQRGKENNVRADVNSVASKTIPKLNADIESKQQQRLHRSVSGMDNFFVHKRSMEVVRQKRILEEMLNEHKQLQDNRKTVAMEILEMRKYLNDIRKKLDVSLRKLESNKTIASACPVRKTSPTVQRRRAQSIGPVRGHNQRNIPLDKRLRN